MKSDKSPRKTIMEIKRELNCVKVADVADCLGMSMVEYREYEICKRKPTVATFYKLAIFYQCNYIELMKNWEETKKYNDTLEN